MSELGGVRKGDVTIWVTRLPKLKKPALAIQVRNVYQKIASFDSEEDAEVFYDLLCRWLNVKEEE